VIEVAGVSRGTFYNYFRTNAELLVAAIQALGNEVVDLVESRVKAFPSPAARLFTGLRLYMDTARRYPLFARFITRVGPQAIGPDALVYKYIPIHIAEGIAAGEFVDANVGVALDMVVGAGLIAVARISAGRADDTYLSAMLVALARSLGLDPIAPKRSCQSRSSRWTSARTRSSSEATHAQEKRSVRNTGNYPLNRPTLR